MKGILLFGGSSFEHEISIVSAITLKERLKGWDLKYIFLDQNRKFFLINPKNLRSDHFSSGKYRREREVKPGPGGFYKFGLFGKQLVEGEVVINLIHGRDGEDGKISGLLEFYKIKAITPPVEGCAVSYNKFFTKFYAEGVGVPVIQFARAEEEPPFPLPVIIKPARLGSSIGVSVARTLEEYRYGVDTAREFDREIIVEPFLEGVEEYNLAGCQIGEKWIFSRIEKVEKGEFLDYNQKYLDFGRKEVVLPPIDIRLEKELKELFKKIYSNYFTNALIRCDFFYYNGKLYLNEINPIPGSLAHYLFKDFPSVLEELAKNLVPESEIKIDYRYIHQIQSIKGK